MEDVVHDDLKIDDLARITGQPRRNIRYLIAKKIVPEPRGAGRWASYGREHVEALSLYSELKDSGIHSLEFIRKKVQQQGEKKGFPLELTPLEGVTVRIEPAALEGMGIDALVEAIGNAVRKAVDSRKGRS